ncbi:helix-turn-helix domain-containing protein [Clostridium cadaveris]|uniref:helix-turn-helix domain-containing protein n=1 Tax=Clostridium cadaveris TaxID=1529 RepID=UPI0015B5541C|nr:helix-turn-helix transcriptional regulator [Clostridium cadaveris]NWK11752.1 helix-turn-helix transcriptional regulator [Clostridium cadaveris]
MTLDELITEKKFSRYKVAKKAGIGQSSLSQIINGQRLNPRMETLISIANALGVSIDQVCKCIKEGSK